MFWTLILLALAIENLTDIIVTVDFLERYRAQWEKSMLTIGKLARCKYCQSFWLSGIAAMLVDPVIGGMFGFVATWLALHLLSQMARIAHESAHEFHERYLNRAPMNIMVMKTPQELEMMSLYDKKIVSKQTPLDYGIDMEEEIKRMQEEAKASQESGS